MGTRLRPVIISIFVFQIALSVTFAADKTNIAVSDQVIIPHMPARFKPRPPKVSLPPLLLKPTQH
jgi:hypothetical protein